VSSRLIVKDIAQAVFKCAKTIKKTSSVVINIWDVYLPIKADITVITNQMDRIQTDKCEKTT